MMQQVAVSLKGTEYTVIKGTGNGNGNGNGTGALVSSKTTVGGWHVIKSGACDCEGFTHRGKCSHLAAVKAACVQERLGQAQQERETLEREAQELAATLDALRGKLAEAQDREKGARTELEALCGQAKAEDKATPHAVELGGTAA